MKRRAMGALEREVLSRLWASKTSMTPAEVTARLENAPAYTTVMTILTRLWRKGLVSREARGRAFAYSPLVTEGEYAARQMRASFEAASNREEALSHFVGALTKREERALRRVIAELDK